MQELTDEERALIVMWLRKYARTHYEFTSYENGEDMLETMDRVIEKLLSQIPKGNLIRMLLEDD